jgi:uncharacterized membrane protein YdbT with pleckstrin-like domain
MAGKEMKKIKYSLVISIIRYTLFMFIGFMIVLGIVSGTNYPTWMLFVLVFLAGVNIGTLIKENKDKDFTLLN